MRVFVAVSIPDEVKEEIAAVQQRLKSSLVDVRWVEIEKFHLTLKFLGEVPEDKVPGIADAVARAAAGVAPFAVSLSGLGAFPSAARPRVVWLGIKDGAAALTGLAGRVETELEALGYAREQRPFSAHLTLGRVRSPQNIAALVKKLAAMETVTTGSFNVTSLDVMQSFLHPRGSRYECVRSISL